MVGTGLLVVSVIAASALWAPAAEAEIRIAVAGDMTGANAWFGEQYQRGTELAVAALNARVASSGKRSSWSWATTPVIPIRRWHWPASLRAMASCSSPGSF